MTAAPTLLDTAALGARLADELLVRGAREIHGAIGDRVHRLVRRASLGLSSVPETAHRGIAGLVYAGVGLGVRGAAGALDVASRSGRGPRLDDARQGRFWLGALNGLIGDRLAAEGSPLAIALSVRQQGRDVPCEPDALAAAFPRATDRVVVLLHGLCETEESWGREGVSYADALAGQGWSPVLLRANTGLSVRENGVALASLLGRLVAAWPVPVRRIALVGHSQGGLVVRAAAAVATEDDRWRPLVRDVVTLATPHLGAPLADVAARAARVLAAVPDSAAFGRLLDQRSRGIHDLVAGLGEEVPPMPGVGYRLVVARRDALVGRRSAAATDRRGRVLFPAAEVLDVPGAGHFDLLGHPVVRDALLRWLPGPAAIAAA